MEYDNSLQIRQVRTGMLLKSGIVPWHSQSLVCHRNVGLPQEDA